MTPAPTKPTPEATLDAIRDGSHRVVEDMEDTIDKNPTEEHIVKAHAPKATNAIVRTPADGC